MFSFFNTNVSFLLKQQAISSPHTIALISNSNQLSFKDLDSHVDALTQFFKKNHFINKKILLFIRPGYQLVVIVYALFRAGAIPVIIDPGMGFKNLQKCVIHSAPDVIFTIPLGFPIAYFIKSKLPFTPKVYLVNKTMLSSWISKGKSLGNVIFYNFMRKQSLAAIVFTSGSTGAPKGVPYTHELFFNQVQALKESLNLNPSLDIDLPLLPIFSIFNPALGITTVVPPMNPSKPASMNPKKMIHLILSLHISNSFGSPTLWKKITTYALTHHIQLPSLKRIILAGTSVPFELLKNLRQIAPNAELFTPYGATESLPLTMPSFQTILNAYTESPHILSKKTVPSSPLPPSTFLGKPIAGAKFKIIPITDEAIPELDNIPTLPPYQIGEIIVNGPTVTPSYYNNLPQTKLSKIHSNDGIWHRMGDLGYLDKSGQLWFCGRKIEKVEIFPREFLYTDTVEFIVNQNPLINQSALIGLGKRPYQIPALVIQLKKNIHPLLFFFKRKKIEKMIFSFLQSHSLLSKIQYIFFQKKLPVDVRHNAKIHRLTLRSKYEKKFNN